MTIRQQLVVFSVGLTLLAVASALASLQHCVLDVVPIHDSTFDDSDAGSET